MPVSIDEVGLAVRTAVAILIRACIRMMFLFSRLNEPQYALGITHDGISSFAVASGT